MHLKSQCLWSEQPRQAALQRPESLQTARGRAQSSYVSWPRYPHEMGNTVWHCVVNRASERSKLEEQICNFSTASNWMKPLWPRFSQDFRIFRAHFAFQI